MSTIQSDAPDTMLQKGLESSRCGALLQVTRCPGNDNKKSEHKEKHTYGKCHILEKSKKKKMTKTNGDKVKH